jgi:GNAT superfamily N-acetyltransferase
MELRYAERASASPAWPLIVEGYFWLTQDGFAIGPPITGAEHAIFAVEGADEVVGVLCWRMVLDTGDSTVALGYVEPSSRRLGVFKAMWNELLARVRHAGAARVLVDAHDGNELMLTVLQRLDMQIIASRYAVNLAVK